MTSDAIQPPDIFQCQKCGDCCRGYGGTFVTPAEIKAISAFLKTDAKRFVSDYCRMSREKPLLSEGKNGYCIFYDGCCSIHPVKPRMCREWPFIQSLLVDIGNWQIMSAFCPGIHTNISAARLKECLKKEISKRSDQRPISDFCTSVS